VSTHAATLDACKADRRVDQTDMAERLWKIAEHAAGARVVFLGEQTEIILQREQALEKHARIIETPLQDVIVRQPETTGEESALAWRHYFAVGHSSECFNFIKDWVEKKVKRHLAHAQKRKGFGWKRWNRRWLYDTLRLFNGYRVRRDMLKVAPAG